MNDTDQMELIYLTKRLSYGLMIDCTHQWTNLQHGYKHRKLSHSITDLSEISLQEVLNSEGKLKPILRDYRDLDQMITQSNMNNGLPFIPAEILYMIGCEGQINPWEPSKHVFDGNLDYKWYDDKGCWVLIMKPDQEQYDIMEVSIDQSTGDVNFCKGDNVDNHSCLYSCVEQEALFDFMYSLHFVMQEPDGSYTPIDKFDYNVY